MDGTAMHNASMATITGAVGYAQRGDGDAKGEQMHFGPMWPGKDQESHRANTGANQNGGHRKSHFQPVDLRIVRQAACSGRPYHVETQHKSDSGDRHGNKWHLAAQLDRQPEFKCQAYQPANNDRPKI